MKSLVFRRWLRSVKKLSSAQKKELRNELVQAERKSLIEEVAALVGIPVVCPHCHHAEIRSWGSAADLPRYRCQGCHRTFGPLTKTPLARLRHKNRWMFFMEGMNEGESVRKAAWRCGINKKASFNWRHRFLTLPEAVMARHETGIVEAGEIYFLQSFKGQRHLPRLPRKRGGRAAKRGLSREQIPVLVIRDRSGATAEAILPADNHREIEAVLDPLVDRDAILCTDGGGKGPLALAARELGIAHRAVNLNKRIRVLGGAFHIQNANAYHSRLKGWMLRFHGVATKYLGHYLGWRRMLERFGASLGPDLWLNLAVGHYEG
jgi:transposase-like protein